MIVQNIFIPLKYNHKGVFLDSQPIISTAYAIIDLCF